MENSATHACVLDEPSLPSELECLIFQIAALSRPKTIPSLMLIAQRVKHWVEPLLYRVLVLSTNKSLNTPGFPCITIDALRSAIARKPPHFFESCVTHILFGGDAALHNISDLETILTACPRVVNVWFFFPGFAHRTRDSFNHLERLRHLAIEVMPLFEPHPIDFTAPMFRNVTHLHLSDSGRKLPADIDARLVLAPALTHISCNCRKGVAALHARIRTAVALRCIVVFTFAEWVESPNPPDTRFVCIEATQMGSRANWLQAAATGDDYWALADAFIAAKHAGRVDDAQYHIRPNDQLSWRT
ncbi:hypothetical protein C8R45DRAFT_873941 [Mycena sanguinolenta]|nr:hypothetical protein C8R45DRAFT_873941 [Mycena sanguinolenta]